MGNNSGRGNFEWQIEEWAVAQSSDVTPELQAKIKASLRPSLHPVRSVPSQCSLVLTFLAIFAAVAAGLVAVLDKAGVRLMTGRQMAGMAIILTAAAVLFSWTLGWQMVPGSRRRLGFSIVLALSGVGVLSAIAALFPWRTSGPFFSEGWPCAALELAIAIAGTAIFWMVARRGALFISPSLGAVLAGFGVILALVPLQTQCMFQQAPHLLVWHFGTAVLIAVLGALMGGWRQSH
jgi:hypothetical protein